MGDVFSYKKPVRRIVLAVIAVCAVIVLCLLTNPKAGDKPGETGVYTGGRFLGQFGGLSYLPLDGSYYDRIILSEDSLRVVSSDGEVLYEGGKYIISRYSYVGLKARLDEDFIIWNEETELTKYKSYGDIEVYSYFKDSSSDIVFSIYRFDGEPLWFAEGESLRIYELVYMGELSETGGIDAPEITLDRLPEDYSLEDAKKDGCVVFEDGDITSGQSVWDSFLKKVNSKEPAKVRPAYYYTLGDPSRYAPELYEEIKDDYPVMYIKDLVYDGEDYTIKGYEDGELISRRYRYLMKYEGEPGSKWAVFSEYVYYVLTNDDSVTWEDIEHGMLSSLMGDQIDHYRVYSDLS